MNEADRLLERYAEQLRSIPAPVAASFAEACQALSGRLPPAALEHWASLGMQLAELNLRSFEAADEFFRASVRLGAAASPEALEAMAHEALAIAADSVPLATAFLRAAPDALQALGFEHFAQWTSLGRRLYKGNWKSAALAGQFFETSAKLANEVRLGQLSRLALFLDELARHSYELASACLAQVPNVFQRLGEEDRLPYLTYALELAQSSWADARLYLDRGPSLLEKVHQPVRERFLLLAAQVAKGYGRSAFQFLEAAAEGLAQLEPDQHHRVIELAEQLAPYSPEAAMEFLANVGRVLERIRFEELEGWHQAGLRILQTSYEGGEAYFRLQSAKSEEMLERLSARVDLARVGEVLRLYCKALTGRNVAIQNAAALAEKGIGWVDETKASTEGTTIFLPETMERYGTKEENFAAYKVFATHQAAHLEFGSFDFRFDRDPQVFERTLPTPSEADSASAITDMERYFDLFGDRQLASDLYTVAEDTRVDAAIKREYGGIRRTLARLQRDELARRPDVRAMPLRQAFVENLIRFSLDGADAILWPSSRSEPMAQALAVLTRLQDPAATVEDSAEAAARLYRIAIGIPNVFEDLEVEWEAVEPAETMATAMEGGELGPEGAEAQLGDVGQGEGEMEYASPPDPDFRGDFKPELVQLLMKLREDAQTGQTGRGQPMQLTPEQLQELLEKSVEIDLDALMEGDLDQTTGLFLSNLQKEAGTPMQDKKDAPGRPTSDQSTGEGEGEQPLEPVVTVYYYDEWDFRAQDYKPRWCAVKEMVIQEGTEEFYEQTLREHAGLVAQTRKQFELMKPEMFRKIKRLRDGEDIDLDAAIEWMVEHRVGANPNDKVYWRRNKIERDVAVAFLIDMSASTDEEIQKRDKRYDDDFDDDPRRYLSWWVSKRRHELSHPPKRIIDVEKESTVLLMTALETIGDQYGIYGFSGYGRDNVEFYVIKDFDEHFDDRIKRRLDKIAPIRSTRMGPAIRHATYKLLQTNAKVRILFLLSDGRPQDHGYGRDRTEKEYAIHDTKQALNEAKREGIIPFALTVDRAGHDYLKTMCQDMGYEVVADIETLPSRLPALYRRLTE